jgi:hypothetical protein
MIYGANWRRNMEIEFENTKELFDRLKPALRTKQAELKTHGYGYIHLIDIWDYLVKKKWTRAHNLSLYDMVSDILNCDNELVDDYVKEMLNDIKRDRF